MNRIYMDHSATTPVSERALNEMLPYFREEFGNPSAIYSYGQTGKNAIEKCRNRIAKCIGALPTEIYFTSGGTESDNWAIRSVCEMKKDKGKHIISTEIEHNAVKRTLQDLEQQGFEVTYLKPDQRGQISAEQLESAIRDDTILITVMLANNVVGTVLDIPALAAAARKRRILFHTDAVQAVAHIPVNVRKLGVDFLSISAHKFNGPKGVGVLFCRLPNRPKPLLTGGGQEKELRSGTENVPAIVGMTAALEEHMETLEEDITVLTEWGSYMTKKISEIPGVHPTGDQENRLPGFSSFLIEGIPHSVMLMNKLNEQNICVSSGSACSASSKEASHVITALGYDEQMATCSLRITLGMDNTKEEVDYAIGAVQSSINALRSEVKSKAPRLEGRVSEIQGQAK
ncbi:MAG: cysteine desulfurase family protein [Lachnospiraceae bacterium]|nr:cysteine desulfurase family protein [Lachnospiraceae bacterium]